MDFKTLIKEYREKEFLTQSDLAKILGVTNITINRWENGKSVPNMTQKRKLNKLFKESGMLGD